MAGGILESARFSYRSERIEHKKKSQIRPPIEQLRLRDAGEMGKYAYDLKPKQRNTSQK